MSRIHISRNGEEPAYSKPIKRALLRDKRLSYGARGLFAMLWDFPSDWVYYSTHIVGMSPNGMTQLKSQLKELRDVGAIEVRPKQLTAQEAKMLNDQNDKTYKAGQIIGKEWILNNPDFWAIEASLLQTKQHNESQLPKDRFSTYRENQLSENPSDGKSTAKGLKQYGSSNKVPPLHENKENTNDALIFPRQLCAKERDAAVQVLSNVEQKRAQELLDELTGRLNTNSIKSSSIGYLRSLVNRHREGKFVPEIGIRVETVRQKQRVTKQPEPKQSSPEVREKYLEKLRNRNYAKK